MKLTTGLRLCPNNILPEQSAARTPRFLRLKRALAPSPCQLTPFPWRSVLSDDVATAALADAATTGRIQEVEIGEDVNTCFISNNDPDPSLNVEGRPDVKFCCEEHRALHQTDDGSDHYPFPVQFRPEVGR